MHKFKIYLVTGAQGEGKSTWIKQQAPEALRVLASSNLKQMVGEVLEANPTKVKLPALWFDEISLPKDEIYLQELMKLCSISFRPPYTKNPIKLDMPDIYFEIQGEPGKIDLEGLRQLRKSALGNPHLSEVQACIFVLQMKYDIQF